MTYLDYIEKRNELILTYMTQLNKEYKNKMNHKVLLSCKYTFFNEIYERKILFLEFKRHNNTICLAYYDLRDNGTYIREQKYIEIDWFDLNTLKMINL